MKLKSITKTRNRKGAFLKNGKTSVEDYDKNDGISIVDALLDPNNLYPIKSEGRILKQRVVIPADEALFFVASIIENGKETDAIFPFALLYDKNGEEIVYVVNRGNKYYDAILTICKGLKSGKIKNSPNSLKRDTGKRIAFGVMTAFYAILALVGVIGSIVLPEYMPFFSLGVCLAPMWLTYYRFHDPFENNPSVGLFVLSIVLSVGMAIGYYLLVKNAVMLLFLLGVYICQIVGYAKFCEDKSSFVVVLIGIGSIIAIPIAVVFFIGTLLVALLKMLGVVFGDTDLGKGFRGVKEEIVYEVIEDGYTRTLRRTNSTYLHSDRYIDDIGRYWYSDDKGTTFKRE